MWIIGVDGGGTKCEAGLFTHSGDLLARARTGPANLFANFTGAMACIEQASEQLFSKCQAQHNISVTQQDCFISLGCAGGSIESVKQHFRQWPHQYAGALLNTDVYVSCLGANKTKACAIFVIGTGSCLAVFTPEDPINMQQFGGHGFILGDIASGAWLGKQALSWYLQALETHPQDTLLLTTLKRELGSSTSLIIETFGQASAREFAELVPVILNVQDSSPTVANWLAQGAAYAANLIERHTDKNQPIFLTGGLATVYKPLIEKRIATAVTIPNKSAIFGAYAAAKDYLNRQNG